MIVKMLTFNGFAGTVLPILAIAFVTAIALVNLFISLRKRFPVWVNCWFCNQDSKVPYDSSNSWVCPSCTQYNGFTEDGDYNREIPEQYQCRSNPHANITDDDKINYSVPYNGLCFGCNRNQELKIHQLASFVPEVEENYDIEVEEYQRQLEQTYKLCSRCERVLNRTLNEVKRNILGSKLAQIGTKGLKVFDLHMAASDKQSAIRKQQMVANISLWMIIALLIIKLFQHLGQIELNKERLEFIFSSTVSQTVLIAVSYFVAFKHTLASIWDGIWNQAALADKIEQLNYLKKTFLNRVFEISDSADDICESLTDTPEAIAAVTQPNALSNLALIALAGMLLGAKSYIGPSKPVVLMLCGVLESLLQAGSLQQLLTEDVTRGMFEIILSLIALVTAIACIGRTAPKIQSSDNLNSSFHKIYSQETAECDYSDASEHQQQQHQSSINNDISYRSLDTTKSISPSVLTSPSMRPFFQNSFATQTSPKSRFGGSILGANRLNTTLQEQSPPIRTPSRQNYFMQESSLLKTPSFSVDNFTTAIGNRPEFSSQKFHGFSMSALNTATLQDDRFGEDIDRLSISGRLSVSRKDLSMINNPFATHHVDHDDSFSLRNRKFTISPPKLCAIAESGSSWIAGGYWGVSPQKNPDGANPSSFIQQPPFMSRTSSQSSGFESQPTRRPTPEEQAPAELDRSSLFSEPVPISSQSVANGFQHRLNQSINLPVAAPSPVPSFISFAGGSNKMNSGHSLFGERNLFQSNPTSMARPTMPFPLQQSQMPPVIRGSGAPAPSSFVPFSQPVAPSPNHRRSLLNLSKLSELPEISQNLGSQEEN
ncbi:uncharacterized protein LOC129718081 [Wyeomyia smithii]|uniref:uncharacterized protein LOC129718081 n=1 Tax=Wyeomyia smithii TaxID=174621 RepID=UPI002467D658|nr:uncharacterized protein LOC129718081 [Wyeomyia smithii]